MISQAHRFHGRNALRFVYQHGQTVRGPAIGLRFARNPRRQNYRLAVVVSRKVSKSAVVRNRIRRRVYEIVRKYARRISESYDLVLTVYSEDISAMPHDELQRSVLALLEKAGLGGQPAAQDHAIVIAKEK